VQASLNELGRLLAERRRNALYRQPRVTGSAQQPELVVDGRPMLSFCSNDYLGLAADPRVAKAFKRGVDRYGSGSGAAHLVTGHSEAHQALENDLAEFTGRDRALLFSSGYMANLGVLCALLGRGDSVLEDRLNHASLIDAGLLSGARFQRYPHLNTEAAASRLGKAKGGKMLVTDAVFSMDGDLADLPELARVCTREQAWLMVDDAHGLGVLGAKGAGSLEHFSLNQQQVPILMGTLGKALGTAGAFVAGPEVLIETLIQQSRTYIYTTALPAAIAEATRTSLQLVARESWRRERLQELISSFRTTVQQMDFELSDSTTPIQPIIAGSSETALDWSKQLEVQGILVTPIRPPTVPEGTARLRITFSASHQDHHLHQLLQALAGLQRK
jgi:8-amino-7-oxononanoate synthase